MKLTKKKQKELTVKILKEIREELTYLEELSGNTDLSDIGNSIGVAIGKHISVKNIESFEMEDFYRGYKHGISLTDGTHP